MSDEFVGSSADRQFQTIVEEFCWEAFKRTA